MDSDFPDKSHRIIMTSVVMSHMTHARVHAVTAIMGRSPLRCSLSTGSAGCSPLGHRVRIIREEGVLLDDGDPGSSGRPRVQAVRRSKSEPTTRASGQEKRWTTARGRWAPARDPRRPRTLRTSRHRRPRQRVDRHPLPCRRSDNGGVLTRH